MTTGESMTPKGTVAMRTAGSSPESIADDDRKIAGKIMDASPVLTEDFTKAMVAIALRELGLDPTSTVTIHDVRKAATLAVEKALSTARALVGYKEDWDEIAERMRVTRPSQEGGQ